MMTGQSKRPEEEKPNTNEAKTSKKWLETVEETKKKKKKLIDNFEGINIILIICLSDFIKI